MRQERSLRRAVRNAVKPATMVTLASLSFIPTLNAPSVWHCRRASRGGVPGRRGSCTDRGCRGAMFRAGVAAAWLLTPSGRSGGRAADEEVAADQAVCVVLDSQPGPLERGAHLGGREETELPLFRICLDAVRRRDEVGVTRVVQRGEDVRNRRTAASATNARPRALWIIRPAVGTGSGSQSVGEASP